MCRANNRITEENFEYNIHTISLENGRRLSCFDRINWLMKEISPAQVKWLKVHVSMCLKRQWKTQLMHSIFGISTSSIRVFYVTVELWILFIYLNGNNSEICKFDDKRKEVRKTTFSPMELKPSETQYESTDGNNT